MSTSLTKLYQVRNEDIITLIITIGHGQVGTTSVHLGNKELVSGHKGTLKITIPGSGKDLNGIALLCSTIVADVRTETNETSVTYELSGGVVPFKQTLIESVTSDGDVVFYTASFHFYV